MKYFYTFILFLSVGYAVAQPTIQATSLALAPTAASEPTTYRARFDNDRTEETFRKNNIKINLSSLALNNYSLSYERSLTRKISFVAGYRFMPEKRASDVWLTDEITSRFLDDEDDIQDDLDEITFSNNAYTGEIRFYTGKKPGARGFYLSLYGRYTTLKSNYSYEYEAESGNYLLPLEANLKGFGGGLMLGSQWLIAKRVVFDWYLIGAHYGKMKGDIDAISNLSNMTAAERADLEQDIEDVIEIGDKTYIDATVTEKGVNAKYDGPFAGIRGLGFNLGIAF